MAITYKPSTGKGPVILLTSEPRTPPTITLANGQTITAERADKHGGAYHNEGAYQFVFPPSVLGQQGATLTVDGKTQKLDNTNLSYRGGDVGSLSPSSKGAIGSGSAGLGGAPGGLNPTPFGAGYLPANLSSQFPQFQPIQTPNYTQFDPATYAQKYGPVIRGENLKNFKLSSDMALATVQNELRGLKAFEPQAAGLAREQAAVDNLQNQSQRTGQLNKVLPDVLQNLKTQTGDAATYASGHLLDSQDDAALAIGATSAATDLASSRGFGDNSFAGKGAQSLMSAKERFQVSQYGNQLVDTNATTRANLELAPTEYINAGQQIKVTPNTDAGAATASYLNQLNGLSQIPASTALATSVNQSQYKTGEELDVAKYNASNVYASQLNKFNYVSGFAQQAADLGTAQVNQTRQDTQTAALQQLFQQGLKTGQSSGTISSLLGALGVAPKLIGGVASLIGGLFGGGSDGGGSGGSSGGLSGLIDLGGASPGDASTYGSLLGGSSPGDTGSAAAGGTSSGLFGTIYNYGVDAYQFFADLF